MHLHFPHEEASYAAVVPHATNKTITAADAMLIRVRSFHNEQATEVKSTYEAQAETTNTFRQSANSRGT